MLWVVAVLVLVALALAGYALWTAHRVQRRVDMDLALTADSSSEMSKARGAIQDLNKRVTALTDALLGSYPDDWEGADVPTSAPPADTTPEAPAPSPAPGFGAGLTGMMLNTVMNTVLSGMQPGAARPASPPPRVEEMPEEAAGAAEGAQDAPPAEAPTDA